MTDAPDGRFFTSYRAPPVAGKPVEIGLSYIFLTNRFKVETVTNTIWYRPGDMLTEEIVGEICKIKDWTIRISNYELLKKFFDVIGPRVPL